MVEYKWKLLSITTIGAFMSSLDGSIVNIALSSISADLSVPFDVIQWVPIIYLLVNAVTLVAFGRLGDIRGRKQIFLTGIALFTVSSGFNALATSGIFLIFSRGIQGIGAALVTSQSIAMLNQEFPPHERGKALGFNVAAVFIGLVAGPVLGGFLVQFLGWRSIFWINIPIGAVLVPLGYKVIKKIVPKAKNVKFDVGGMILFGLFLAPLLLTLSIYNYIGISSPFIIVLLVISIVGLIGFVRVELRTKDPMLKIELFSKNRVFASANLTALLNFIALSGIAFLFAIYLQTFLQFPPSVAGLIIMPTPIMMAIMSPLSGRLSDKIGTRILTSLGMGIIAAAISFTILVIWFLPWQFFILSQIILGTGSGLFASPNQSAVMGSLDKKDSGIAAGTINTMRVTGQSASVALLGAIVGIFIPQTILNPILNHQIISISSTALLEFNTGLTVALILSICLCIIGVFTSLLRGKERIYKKTLNDKNNWSEQMENDEIYHPDKVIRDTERI